MKTKLTYSKSGYACLEHTIGSVKNSLILFFAGIFSLCIVSSKAQVRNTNYGIQALANNSTGDFNAAFGFNSLFSNTDGSYNTAAGYKSLYLNTTASYNTAYGYKSLYSNSTGYYNTAIGYQSSYSNTIGIGITATGFQALYFNTTGNNNTAAGFLSLYNNTSGSYNTANGASSLISNTEGNSNTAYGRQALYYNTTGSYNTATGDNSLFFNTTGSYNTANGSYSLYNNKGSYNTASGRYSMYHNTTGLSNTTAGYNSLYSNTTGGSNTAIGNVASYSNVSGGYNTSQGYGALYSNSTGYFNTAIGAQSDVSSDNLSNATAIGYGALVNSSNKVRVGNASVTSIGGQVSWSTFSDGRYKNDIKEDVTGLAFINGLRPVTYHVNIKKLNDYFNKEKNNMTDYSSPGNSDAVRTELKKAEETASRIVYNGFIAQEVEQAAKKLNYEFSGVDKPQSNDGLYGLRYADFVVPLVKAVQELSQQNSEFKSAIANLTSQIDELKAIVSGNTFNPISNERGQLVNFASPFLEQNVPNPFNHTTVIDYTLPRTYSSANIIVTDRVGKVCKKISISGSGKGNIKVDATTLAAGAYNYSMYVDGKLIDTKQMVLTK